jgi:hypothetical protein
MIPPPGLSIVSKARRGWREQRHAWKFELPRVTRPVDCDNRFVVSTEVKALLEQQDWGKILKTLTLAASRKLRRYVWRGEFGGVPAALAAEDFAMEAVAAVYRGERVWDPVRHPDLVQWLLDVVFSKISHASTAASNAAESPWPDSPWVDLGNGACSDEERAIIIEIVQRLDGDPLLQRIVRCVAEGYDTPSSVAERLGIGVDEVHNAKKRLRRRLTEMGYGDSEVRN